MLATQLLDVVFVGLYAAGIESIGPAPGTDGSYGSLLGNIDWSHSLVGALGISLAAALVTMIFWGRRNAVIIGAVVFSHWILDLLVHRPDLAILPGNANNLPRLGLGLWQIPYVTFAIELVLVLAGAYLYYHAAMRRAVRVERDETRGSGILPGYNEPERAPSTNYRQQALIASLVMFVLLLGTLLADAFIPFQG
jgi:hypothetical protein